MPASPIPNAYWLPGGRILAGEYPGATYGDDAHDKIGRILDAGVTSFVDLTEPDWLEPYESVLADEAERRGISARYTRLTMPDMDVPESQQMSRILDYIDAEIAAGQIVYVHCWGGVGRTGMVVGCHFVRGGASGDEALAHVGKLWRTMSASKQARHPEGSPQTNEQREFVRRWPATRSTRAYPDRHSRIRGCLLGGAVGDTLGAPVEFLRLGEIRRRYGPRGIEELDEAYGRVGAITDDTQMTLFTAEGLLRTISREKERGITSAIDCVHRAYMRWLRTQRPGDGDEVSHATDDGWLVAVPSLHEARAPGITCLTALQSGRVGTTDEPINNSKGCGGVMRAAPVGLITGVDHFRLGCDIAAITHGHPTGWLAAGALSLIIARLLAGEPLLAAVGAAIERLRDEPEHKETSTALQAALVAWRAGPPRAEVVEGFAVNANKGGGWIAEEALGIAVYCALAAGEDFAAGVRLAVNHTGDSDSTGAIAGNILGALFGDVAIPTEWLQQLEMREEITQLADDVAIGWRDGPAWRLKYPPN